MVSVRIKNGQINPHNFFLIWNFKNSKQPSPIKIFLFFSIIPSDLRKMVYYTALPLIMQTEASASQLCACPSDTTDAGRPSTSSNSPNQYHQLSTATSAMHSNVEVLHSYTPSATYHVVPPQKPMQVQQPMLQPPPQKPQFKCEQCNMCFGSKSAHTSHIKSHAKQFPTQQSLQQPIAATTDTAMQSPVLSVPSVSPSDPYQCDVCKKTFSVPARLVSEPHFILIRLWCQFFFFWKIRVFFHKN